jgi:hypothetical protein
MIKFIIDHQREIIAGIDKECFIVKGNHEVICLYEAKVKKVKEKV